MVIYNRNGLGCFWRNLLLHKMSRVSIWAGLISEGPETQSGAVPELIKEAWRLWTCGFVMWSDLVVQFSINLKRSRDRKAKWLTSWNWYLGDKIQGSTFKNLMLDAGCSVISQFQLSVCLRYHKVKQKSYREVQDLHLSTSLLIFKDGTAQWRMKNYGTAHFRGQS